MIGVIERVIIFRGGGCKRKVGGMGVCFLVLVLVLGGGREEGGCCLR